MKMKAKRIAFLGLLTALAMILSFVESQIPPLVAIPGIKVGLPNLVVVFLLYRFGWKEAVAVSIVRVLLVSLLFGNVQTMLFSIAGAALSLVGMIILKRWFATVTTSVAGGVLHNVGQILMAIVVTSTEQIIIYLPVLLISGIIAGVLIGLVSGLVVKKLEKYKF